MKVETVKTLIEEGVLPATPAPPQYHSPEVKQGKCRHRIVIIHADAVHRLRATLRSQLSLIEVAARLGICEKTARALVREGLLERHNGLGRQKRCITEASLARFLQRVCGPAHVFSTPEDEGGNGDALTLYDAQRLAIYYSVRLPELLYAVEQGLLRARRMEGPISLRTLWFHECDVRRYLSTVKLPDGTRLLSRMEVLRVLGCTHKTLRRLRDRGLLLPATSDDAHPKALWRYSSRDVEAFLGRYVSSAEAAGIVGCTRSSLDEAARDGRLPEGAIAFVGRFTLDDAKEEGASRMRRAVRRYDRVVLEDWVRDRIELSRCCRALGRDGQHGDGMGAAWAAPSSRLYLVLQARGHRMAG